MARSGIDHPWKWHNEITILNHFFSFHYFLFWKRNQILKFLCYVVMIPFNIYIFPLKNYNTTAFYQVEKCGDWTCYLELQVQSFYQLVTVTISLSAPLTIAHWQLSFKSQPFIKMTFMDMCHLLPLSLRTFCTVQSEDLFLLPCQ